MPLCRSERSRIMGSLFCLVILQILCCSITATELKQNTYLMSDKFINSSSSVLQSIWRKEPYISCNIPIPPVSSLKDRAFLTFNLNHYLCVILYDASLRYSNLQVPESFPHNYSAELVQKIIEGAPKPQDFCHKMKENVWSTDIEENKKWLQEFNVLMKNEMLCNRYCVLDIVNPLCVYVLWLDTSVANFQPKARANEHPKEFQMSYSNLEQLTGQSPIQTKGVASSLLPTREPSVISQAFHHVNTPHTNSKPVNTINHQNSSASGIIKNDKIDSTHEEHVGAKKEDSPSPSATNISPNSDLTSYPFTGDMETVPGIKKPKPPVLDLGRQLVANDNKYVSVAGQQNDVHPKDSITNIALTNNSPGNEMTYTDPNTHTTDGTRVDIQYADVTHLETGLPSSVSATSDIKIENHDNGKPRETLKVVSTKDNVNSVTSESKLKLSPGGTTTKQKGNDQLAEDKPKANLENEGNPVDEGISDGGLALDPANHEEQRDFEEAVDREDRPEEQSPEVDVVVPTAESRFGGESDDPPVKPNPSPKITDYADDLSDEDIPNSINTEHEKVTQNDADAGIYVHDRFGDAEDSHFFAYFMTMIIFCIIGYLIFHNKQKILALALEGRVRKGNRRRPSTSGYRKLDSNLEEAVTSNCSGATVTHVIY